MEIAVVDFDPVVGGSESLAAIGDIHDHVAVSVASEGEIDVTGGKRAFRGIVNHNNGVVWIYGRVPAADKAIERRNQQDGRRRLAILRDDVVESWVQCEPGGGADSAWAKDGCGRNCDRRAHGAAISTVEGQDAGPGVGDGK